MVTIKDFLAAKNINHVALSMRWVVLAVGTGQLSLPLLGPGIYVTLNGTIGLLFGLYLKLMLPKQKRTVIKSIFLSTLLLSASTFLYNYIVLLDVQNQLIIVNIFGILVFCIVGLITSLFSKRHVAA